MSQARLSHTASLILRTRQLAAELPAYSCVESSRVVVSHIESSHIESSHESITSTNLALVLKRKPAPGAEIRHGKNGTGIAHGIAGAVA